MTVWKRDHIAEQIDALMRQTNPPAEIWIYHCCESIEFDRKLLKKYPTIKYQHNTSDLGYFGRYALALFAKHPYIYILDDDVIPSENWIENCIELCRKYNSIICSAGRVIPKDDYTPESTVNKNIREFFVGDIISSVNNICYQDTFVDFGCNSWFIKSEWLKYFWQLKPYSFDTGEDIHLSASCAILGDIRTLCPTQDEYKVTGNRRAYYGFDNVASWKKEDFIDKRRDIFKYLIDVQGWRPLRW